MENMTPEIVRTLEEYLQAEREFLIFKQHPLREKLKKLISDYKQTQVPATGPSK